MALESFFLKVVEIPVSFHVRNKSLESMKFHGDTFTTVLNSDCSNRRELHFHLGTSFASAMCIHHSTS